MKRLQFGATTLVRHLKCFSGRGEQLFRWCPPALSWYSKASIFMWVLTTQPRVLMSRSSNLVRRWSIDTEHLKPPTWVRVSETCRDDGAPDHQADSVWEALSNSLPLFSVHLYIWLKKVQETRLKIIKIIRTKWCDKKGSGWLLIQTSVTREAPSCEKSTLIHLQTSSPSLEGRLNKAKPESQRWKFTQRSKTDDDILNHFIINSERPAVILHFKTWT